MVVKIGSNKQTLIVICLFVCVDRSLKVNKLFFFNFIVEEEKWLFYVIWLEQKSWLKSIMFFFFLQKYALVNGAAMVTNLVFELGLVKAKVHYWHQRAVVESLYLQRFTEKKARIAARLCMRFHIKRIKD